MIRITIQESAQTISFTGSEEILLRLIAGCSVDPSSLAELLIASNIYQHGIAAAIMADLMEFDKTLNREGPAAIHAAISRSQAAGEFFEMTFQVFDEITAQAAMQPADGGLVLIDLPGRTIRASDTVKIPPSGEVLIPSRELPPAPSVTYILPQSWSIQLL